MHKRAESEAVIRKLALLWMKETDFIQQPGHYPSFFAFSTWLSTKHFDHYLQFRSTSRRSDAEAWFESEIRDYWRAINNA